jgi:regulator of PEP synthase PpsR (kinase-PPPase family)
MTQKSPIYIVSGGAGMSGQQLVRTALAQFHDPDTPVEVVPHVQRVEQLEAVITQALESGGFIVHTLVDTNLRSTLNDLAQKRNVVAIDLMGPLLFRLTGLLGEKPQEKPGLYRQLREDYFKRIEAIEFTVDHDDGRKTADLHLADIVLTGVSRVGKTPLSMYLSTLGWKVANVPLIPQLTPPEELFQTNRRRVVGLDIRPEQLIAYRRRRQQRLGMSTRTAYSDLDEIESELEFARRIFRQGRFKVIDITDRPIEESADEIVTYISRQSGV